MCAELMIFIAIIKNFYLLSLNKAPERCFFFPDEPLLTRAILHGLDVAD